MAMNEKQTKVVGPVSALACTVPYMLGMVLIYVGERLVGTPPEIRLLLDGIGLVGILWALVGRVVNVSRSGGTYPYRCGGKALPRGLQGHCALERRLGAVPVHQGGG